MATLSPPLASALLIILSASPLFISAEEGIIEETATTTEKPLIRPYHLDFLQNYQKRYEEDKCRGSGHQMFNHTFADDLDMQKMMGRWFEGLVHPRYHHTMRKGHKCMVYEFGRLIMAHQTTSFDVVISYKLKSDWDMKDFGYMRSSEPRNAMLAFHISTYPYMHGTKFWIYKVGPEGKDSFGRVQYEYAIVAECYMRFAVVLVRNPGIFKDKYQKEVVNWLTGHGYEISAANPMVQPSYFDCYYDSVTLTEGLGSD